VIFYFRDCGDFGFKDQPTQSALSIPCNITKGVERATDKETIHAHAQSLKHKYIGMKIEYIDRVTGKKWISELEEIHKMIGGLKKSQKTQTANY